MNIEEALEKWDYKDTKKNREQIVDICRNHPETCSRLEPIVIKKKAVKPYLRGKGNRDKYSQIIYAVQNGAHLFPETIKTDDDHLRIYIDLLCKAGLIEKIPHKKKYRTENYVETPKAGPWLTKRKAFRTKVITEAAGNLIPDIHIL